ncbi:transposase-like protein [Colletotrichum kahawae]|uniref:Transposase-like protein n=1 Tax=Colletotrichum kahawae TaxID=34407 RepID=A0AAE0D483_COLKA|nr:transposase-like protein [Colletotrichum kahawae]
MGIEYLLSYLVDWKMYYNASINPGVDNDDEA